MLVSSWQATCNGNFQHHEYNGDWPVQLAFGWQTEIHTVLLTFLIVMSHADP